MSAFGSKLGRAQHKLAEKHFPGFWLTCMTFCVARLCQQRSAPPPSQLAVNPPQRHSVQWAHWVLVQCQVGPHGKWPCQETITPLHGLALGGGFCFMVLSNLLQLVNGRFIWGFRYSLSLASPMTPFCLWWQHQGLLPMKIELIGGWQSLSLEREWRDWTFYSSLEKSLFFCTERSQQTGIGHLVRGFLNSSLWRSSGHTQQGRDPCSAQNLLKSFYMWPRNTLGSPAYHDAIWSCISWSIFSFSCRRFLRTLFAKRASSRIF